MTKKDLLRIYGHHERQARALVKSATCAQGGDCVKCSDKLRCTWFRVTGNAVLKARANHS